MNVSVPSQPFVVRTALLSSPWRRLAGPLGLYAILALVLTYPVAGRLGSAAAGFDGRDPFQHVWYQWWLKETLLELGAWPDRVTTLYYPLGADHPVLALHPYVPLASLPLTLLLGPLASYNLAFLLGFILAGLAGYLLCRGLACRPGAALVGGLIFAFYPNRWGHAAAGHLLLTTNYFLPLYALSLLVLLRRPSLKRAIWHGVTAGLLALAQPTHIGYGLLPVLLVLLGGAAWSRLRSGSKGNWPAVVGWLAVAYVGAAVLFLPFAWPTLAQSRQGSLAYLVPPDLTGHATDLLAFLMPSPYHPFLAWLGWTPPWSRSIVTGWRDLEEQLAYPGLVAAALAAVALWWRRPGAIPWLVLTLACALLSLGPFLKVGGQVQAVTLPYAWLTVLPFFEWSRAPGRLNETVMLGVAVLAAMGLDRLWPRLRLGPLRPAVLAAGLAGLILAEYLVIWPFPTEERPVPDYYRRLAGEAPGTGVLEMPVTGSRRASNYAMYYQTIHEHPLAGGYIERDPPGTVPLKEFLNALLAPLASRALAGLPGGAQRRAVLAEMGLARVIAHPALMTDRAARATLANLPAVLGPPVFEDEELQAYPIVPAPAAADPARLLLTDADNWEAVDDGAALRLKGQGYLFIYAREAGAVRLELRLKNPSEPVRLAAVLNDTARLAATAEPAGGLALSLPLRRGLNYVSLAAEPAGDVDFERVAAP